MWRCWSSWKKFQLPANNINRPPSGFKFDEVIINRFGQNRFTAFLRNGIIFYSFVFPTSTVFDSKRMVINIIQKEQATTLFT